MMNYFFSLFDRSDCFLCKFYKWVKSFFVYDDSPSKLVSHGARTSPFEHFTTYHPELFVVFIVLLFVAIFMFCIWASKSSAPRELDSALGTETGGGSSGSSTSSSVPFVRITLYSFKTIPHKVGDEYYPDIPTREGYAFTGWFYDPSFTKPFMPGKKLKKDITLYPRWQKE